MSHLLFVQIWIHPGREAAFAEFEAGSVPLLARHGGRIERALRVARGAPDAPYEVHLVTFPDAAAFHAYSSDADIIARAAVRATVIARTVSMECGEVTY